MKSLNVTSNVSGLPYGISWRPDSLGFAYTIVGEGTWIYDISNSSQKLLIKDGYDADWSPDGKELVFTDNKGLAWVTDNQDQNRIPVKSPGGIQIRADFPEWVPIIGFNSIVYWDYRSRWILHNIDSGQEKVLLSSSDNVMKELGYSVQWSPDGHWFIGMVNHPFGIGALPQAYLCSIDKGECNPMGGNILAGTNYCGYALWTNSILSPIPTPTPFETASGIAWEFNTDGNTEGWQADNQIIKFQVNKGDLTGESTGGDPYMFPPHFAIDAKTFPIIEIKMSVTSGESAQIFIRNSTDRGYFTEAESLKFRVYPDANYHTYILDMTEVKGWNGTITWFRFDPTDANATFKIDYIRIKKR